MDKFISFWAKISKNTEGVNFRFKISNFKLGFEVFKIYNFLRHFAQILKIEVIKF